MAARRVPAGSVSAGSVSAARTLREGDARERQQANDRQRRTQPRKPHMLTRRSLYYADGEASNELVDCVATLIGLYDSLTPSDTENQCMAGSER